jgi:hypothetical protein
MERRTGRGARDVSQKGKLKVFFSEVHSNNRIDSKNEINSENRLDYLHSRFLVHLEDRSIQVRRLDLGVREIEISGEGGGRRIEEIEELASIYKRGQYPRTAR